MSNVLFVDDFKEAADALADIASALGHRSAVAYNGASALALAGGNCFDVILLDLTLPDADGHDVCLQLREGQHSGARIIALTGHAELVGEVMQCFDGCALKPVDIDHLQELLA
ncbi:response regulator transcription factor [Caballeronia sp. S22]|uniref:response regulator transcription factor n=1 Tax=Caballeronia sp. S22 TaxID=3137182 RepID=UPI0035313ACD